MAVDTVGGVNNYSSTYFQGRKSNPKDWKCDAKPLWVQEQERAAKRKKRVGILIGLGAAAGLAFIFRGKIKQGYALLKPHIAKITTPVKDFLKTKTPKLAKVLADGKRAVVDFGGKAVKFVSDNATKAWNAVKGIFKKP